MGTFIKKVTPLIEKQAAEALQKKVKEACGLVGQGDFGVWQKKSELNSYESVKAVAEVSLLKGDYAKRVQNMTKEIEKEPSRCC